MARARDPSREKAFEIWKQYGGNIKLKEIADKLGISEGTVRGWKNKDDWEGQLNGTFQLNARNVPKLKERSNGTERNADDISWLEIEKEYVTDIRRKPCTLKSLSEKFSIPIQTVKEYAARNDWTAKRDRHRTTVLQKTTEKTAELISTDIAKATARHLRVSEKLLAVIEEALGDEKQFFKYVEKIRTGYGPGEFDEKVEVEVLDALNEAKLLNTVAAMEKLQKMQRQVLGIMDEKDRRKLELEERQLSENDDEEQETVEDWVSSIQAVAARRREMRQTTDE
ncbi:phage terminase small subunit-related protein [Brevibacillus fluminis]|uniref:phage terminase small subunit-related protein n=1 Tax=Brevibacillus fluminis TaxID=511487 RepID=UPI003F8BC404